MEIGANSIFELASLLVNIIGAGATAVLAILVFRWTKKSEKNEVTRQIQGDWRDYNLAILADKDLQNIESQNHIVDNLRAVDVKKMCIYFIKINVPYNMWIASKSELLEYVDVDREISNQSKLLHKDQAFIEEHIFPRGYEIEFCDLFRTKWAAQKAEIKN